MPISVVASFKKIKSLISSHSQLAAVLHKSSKLVSFFLQSCFRYSSLLTLHICFLTFVITYFLDALQVVSEDGKKLRRQHLLTESEMEELQVGLFTSWLVLILLFVTRDDCLPFL